MPVGGNGIGVSGNTPYKHETMKRLFDVWCKAVAHIIRKYGPCPVRYIDLTAGNGEPGTFVSSVREIALSNDIEIEMMCFESNSFNAVELSENNVNAEFVCDERWQEFQSLIMDRANGSRRPCTFIYHDPNSDYANEHRDLYGLVCGCRYADFAIHLDATQMKRCRGAGYSHFDISRLLTVKAHNQVREINGPVGQWSILWLSNCPMGDYGKYGFYKASSDHGQSILHKLCHTEAEYREWLANRNGERRLF